MSEKILMGIAVTAELTGTELSKHAVLALEAELGRYPEDVALAALDRCRKELTGRLTLAAIIERINEHDGRPASDEAWATAVRAEDENETVVWTDETRRAMSVARPLLELGDKVGARMAFRDAYQRFVNDARADRVPVSWSASLGWDAERRREVLTDAVAYGLLPSSFATGLMPAPKDGVVVGAVSGDRGAMLRLVAVDGEITEDNRTRALRRLQVMRKMLFGQKGAA